MNPNPFTEVGRVYCELQDLRREVQNKANNWEVNDLKSSLTALSKDVTTINECIMDICNQLQRLEEKQNER